MTFKYSFCLAWLRKRYVCTTQSKALVYLFIMLVSSFYSGALHKQRRLDFFYHLPLLAVLFSYQFILCSKFYFKVLPLPPP